MGVVGLVLGFGLWGSGGGASMLRGFKRMVVGGGRPGGGGEVWVMRSGGGQLVGGVSGGAKPS